MSIRYISATELYEDYFATRGVDETLGCAVLPEDYALRQLFEGLLELQAAYYMMCSAVESAVVQKANQERSDWA